MPHRIGPVLQRTLALLLAALIPATGRRRTPTPRPRSGNRPAPTTTTCPRTTSGLRLLIRALTPPRSPGRPGPRPNSSAGTALTDPFPLVRPYVDVLTHEQHRRRTELDGNGIGTPAPQAVAA